VCSPGREAGAIKSADLSRGFRPGLHTSATPRLMTIRIQPRRMIVCSPGREAGGPTYSDAPHLRLFFGRFAPPSLNWPSSRQLSQPWTKDR